MHIIREWQVEEIQSAFAEVEFFNKIMGIAVCRCVTRHRFK